MKVYVVYSIPDYIGIDIEKIFAIESDAIEYCRSYNSSHPSYDRVSYEEYEVIGVNL